MSDRNGKIDRIVRPIPSGRRWGKLLFLMGIIVALRANSATGAVASVPAEPGFHPASQSAGAVVLVNSQSARYLDFQRFIQPYLDNFGFPYTVLDLSTNPPDQSISNCAVMIIGHSQLDTNRTFLSPAVQSNLSAAVANGTGLVNFDSDLYSGTGPRYQFLQDLFGFSYASAASATNVSLPPTEPASQMHYVTALHSANDSIALRTNMNLTGVTHGTNVKAVAIGGGWPLVAVTSHGQGRAVQWTSYGWTPTSVLGPLEGLDDLVWRGVVWAARKPFVMRGLPNLVVLRMDDVSGPFWWVRVANQAGFKPWLGLFLDSIDNTEAAELSSLVNGGQATASLHSFDCCGSFFYFNHAAGTAYSDGVMSNNYAAATQWHASHNVPISKVVAPHYSEIGANAFAGLAAWGVEYVPIEIVPGTVEYATPGAPWLIGGPYRLYESPQPGRVKWPLWYADWLSVPGHPELNGRFFNCYVEVRDDSPCHEWCPADADVAGSIGRGTRQVKRALDSMALGQLYTHEWYLLPIPQSSNQTPISSNNWSAILQGITNNLGPYNPSYVTLDYACQYVRATRTSRLLTSAYDPATGQITLGLSGVTDLDTSVYVFAGADTDISSSFGAVPAFSGSVTVTVRTAAANSGPPGIMTEPTSLVTNAGAGAVFTVDASGTAPLGYQWIHNLAPLADGVNIAGATTAKLTLAGVTGTNAGDYSVVITNMAGNATSALATLTVVRSPQFVAATLGSNHVPLFLVRAVSNVTYRLDASTNLVDWTTLTNVPNPTGTFQCRDPQAADFPRRFYRAVWVP